MNEAYSNGYATGLNDLHLSRWDADNVIVPARYMNHSKAWYDGYESSTRERYEVSNESEM